MIKFNITESFDSDCIGEYEFGKNIVSIGTRNSDCIIPNDIKLDQFGILEIREHQLYFSPFYEMPYFIINEKRATKTKKIRPFDKIILGETKFEITEFVQESEKSRKNILEDYFISLKKNNPELIPVLESLNQLKEKIQS